MKRFVGLLILLLGAWSALGSADLAPSSSETVHLVHDFFPGEFAGDDPPKPQLTRLGRTLFFVMSDLDTGPGVWRTDGTPGGTRRVLVPESTGELCEVKILGVVAGRIVWSAAVVGEEGVQKLFAAGETGDAAVLYTGPLGRFIKIIGGQLFFLDCAERECSIWSTDGTAEETKPVPELAGRIVSPYLFETFADRWLVFQEGTALHAYDRLQRRIHTLLRSRGGFRVFPVGENLFILTGSEELQEGVWASRLSAPQAKLLFSWGEIEVVGWRGGRFYFSLDDGRVWSTDGSREGTWSYRGFRVEYFSFFADQLGPMGSRSLLPMPGYETASLLSIDEERREVQELRRLCNNKYQCLGLSMSPLTLAGGWGFEEINRQLVRSDGTRKGTTQNTGLTDVKPESFMVLGDRLLLGAARRDVQQLWETDGTAEGTRALSNGTKDEPFRVQGPPITYNGALFVAAERKPVGSQLWKIGGGRTSPVSSLRHLASGVNPAAATWAGGRILLEGYGPGHEPGRWYSVGEEGVPEELPRYRDACEGYGFYEPCALPAVRIGERLLFARTDGQPELWSTNGRAAGTFPVQKREGEILDVAALGRLGDRALVVSPDGSLWSTNGAPWSATKLAKLPTSPRHPGAIKPVGAPVPLGSITFLFRLVPNPEVFILELWRTDGTQGGTFQLASMPYPKKSSPFLSPVTIGGRLFFRFSGTLWISDGTVEGTHPVPEQLPGGTSALVAGESTLYAVGGYLDDDRSVTLWAIDPETLAARSLGDFRWVGYEVVGKSFGSILGDTLLFEVPRPGRGSDVWRTDGTAASTRPLPAMPSPSGSGGRFFSAGDQRYFTACDPEHGCELWATDRLGENVRLVVDLWPGPRSSDARILAVTDKALLIVATEPSVGSELWKIDLIESKRTIQSRGW